MVNPWIAMFISPVIYAPSEMESVLAWPPEIYCEVMGNDTGVPITLVAAKTFVDSCCELPASSVSNVHLDWPRILTDEESDAIDNMTLLSGVLPVFVTVKLRSVTLPAVSTESLLSGTICRTDLAAFGDTTRPTGKLVVCLLP